MEEQLAHLPERLTSHLQLTLLALTVASAISLPLGIMATRTNWLKQASLSVASVIQTIPGLALLAVMVPALTFFGLSGIGFLPAIIGLTLYCIFPILMATVTGITEVDPAMTEAAQGVGMTEGQQLRMVQIPLAMPVIVTGLRTATVWCVGIATLSTPVGAPSLGNYIFGGLQTRNYAAVLIGCIAAAGLAQLLDRLIWAIEVGIRTRRKTVVRVAGGILAALFLYTGATGLAPLFQLGSDDVRIGAKTFTEQYIVADILSQTVAREEGRGATVIDSLGSTVAFDALKAGDIDLYVDYSGTIWASIMGREDVPENRGDVRTGVAEYLQEEHGIEVLAALGFENAYALAMRRDRAVGLGVTKLTELTPVSGNLTLGGDLEFFDRQEWASLQEVYGLDFDEERTMDPALMYQAVDERSVDAITAYTTDGRIVAMDLVVLEDDRGAIPPYEALVLASPNFSGDNPELAAAIRALDGTISSGEMRRLNAMVDADGSSPREAATSFMNR